MRYCVRVRRWDTGNVTELIRTWAGQGRGDGICRTAQQAVSGSGVGDLWLMKRWGVEGKWEDSDVSSFFVGQEIVRFDGRRQMWVQISPFPFIWLNVLYIFYVPCVKWGQIILFCGPGPKRRVGTSVWAKIQFRFQNLCLITRLWSPPQIFHRVYPPILYNLKASRNSPRPV